MVADKILGIWKHLAPKCSTIAEPKKKKAVKNGLSE